MDNLWIIGGGKFGLKAATALSKADSLKKVTIVENQSAVCSQLERLGFEVVCSDAIQFVVRNLTSAHFPEWIVPAVPLHLAYEWIKAKISAKFTVERIDIPQDLVKALPNPIPGETGQLFISIADFQCPASCSEPDGICTYTGKPRPMILHEFLRSIQLNDFQSVAIHSHQLAAGVGGYTPAALFDALSQIEDIQAPVLLSTACSCHGVMNAFKLIH
ncbi:MAG: NAD-binding protein [Desulfobacterales bacterium]|jgi:hypothetical protein